MTTTVNAGGQPEDAVIAGVAVHQQPDHHEPACRRRSPAFPTAPTSPSPSGPRAAPRAGSRCRSGRARTRPPAARGRRSAAPATRWWRRAPSRRSTTASTISSTRFLLCRSASRPISGVAAAAASRLAVTAQLTATIDALSWSAMMPSTGTTAVCSTATVSTTTLSPATSSRGPRDSDRRSGRPRRFGLDHARSDR